MGPDVEERKEAPAPSADGLVVSETRGIVGRRRSSLAIAGKKQLADAVDYGLEYVPSPMRGSLLARGVDEKTAEDLRATVNSYDVALFTKPGCGFCARAESLAAGLKVTYAVRAASKEGNLSLHLALRAALNRRGPPSYPVVVVRGTYVGGFDDFEALAKDPALWTGERVPYDGLPNALPSHPSLEKAFDARLDAAGVHWLKNDGLVQFSVFANAIRAYALAYVFGQLAAAAVSPSPVATWLTAAFVCRRGPP